MDTLRIGFAGAGYAANFHVESFKKVYGVKVEFAGVTSRRAESRDAFAEKHGIKSYASVDELLEHIDVLDVVSSPAAHDDAVLKAAAAGKHVICEKPFSGYFGPEGCGDEYHGDTDPKEKMLDAVVGKLETMATAIRRSGVLFGYAENFVYAPAVQKEREIVEKTGARILRMLGEEAHNGSQSKLYGFWRYNGGGALMGKGCHPLSAVLYLKQIEGLARGGKPIRPKSVTCRCEKLTECAGFEDRGFIRTGYHDIEDNVWAHITFEDGTVADILSGEIVLGGISNYVEVIANNHRTRCNLSPTAMLDVYNPQGAQFKDIYTVEKISTKEGWTSLTPDENYTLGYIGELQDFAQCIATGRQPQADLQLALDTITTIYAAYLSDERKGTETAIPLV
jgi:predicted dehydrogenase